MMDSMKNVPENELFSAYVDGELTAAEQAEVERALAASPEARRLVDDLRALGSTLQALPVQRLDQDLSGEILRVAEHRMLSGRAESQADLGEPLPESIAWRAFVRRWTRPRIWLWPALAVAVSLLLVVLQPEQGRREVPAPGEKVVALAPPARKTSEPPAIGALVEAEAKPEAEKTDQSFARRLEDAKAASGPEMQGRSAPVPMLKAPAAPAADAASPAEPAKALAPEAVAPSAKAPVVAAMPSQPEAATLAENMSKAAGEVTIVVCDVTSEAIPFVEQVLANRQLALLADWDDIETDRKSDFQDGTVLGAVAGAPKRDSQKTSSRSADKMLAGIISGGAAVKDDEGVVAFHVEATPEQLEAVLADLQSRPEFVRSIARNQIAGPIAEGDLKSLLQSAVASAVKPTGKSPAAELSLGVTPRQAKAGGSAGLAPRRMLKAPPQDRSADGQTAANPKAPLPARKALEPAETEKRAPDLSPAHRQSEKSPESGKATPSEQQTKSFGKPELHQARQRAVESKDTPALDAVAGDQARGLVVFVLRSVGNPSEISDRVNPPEAEPPHSASEKKAHPAAEK